MSEVHVMLENVRVSFPHLWKKPVFHGQEGSYGARFLFNKDADAKKISEVKSVLLKLRNEGLKGIELPPDRICLRDGDKSGRAEYAGCWVLHSNSDKRPYVVNQRNERVEEAEQDKIYAGCRVNAKVGLWAMNNQWGKRLNGKLIAIQFEGDDEPFDGHHVSEEEALSGFAERETTEDMFG